MTRLHPSARWIIPLILMLALLVMLALARDARATHTDDMALLDAALAEPTRNAELAVMALGRNNRDPLARATMATAAAEALLVLNAVGEPPTCRLWFRTSWVAWMLLARSIVDLDTADEAELALDGNLRDVAMVAFGLDAAGYPLLATAAALRLESPCTPAAVATPSPSPTPKPTPVPVQTRAP